MVKQVTEIVAGIIVDETTIYSIQEVSYVCGVSVEVIEEMIEHGLVSTTKKNTEQHIYPHDLRRVKIALRLQKDLGVNLPGAALALDLLHELEELRSKINLLERQMRE